MESRTAERSVAAALVVFGAFQAALAAGAPWGRAAYGGNHDGVLPGNLRATSAVATGVYAGAVAATLSGAGSPRSRSRGFAALSAFMGLGVVLNGASRSPLERNLWTPLTAITAVMAWRSRPSTGLVSRGEH